MNKICQMKQFSMVLLAFLLIINLGSRVMAGENPAGKILRIKGSVIITRHGNEIAGLANSKIYPLDEIRTGPQSLAEFILRDGSSLHLGPDSSFELIRYKFSVMKDNPSFIARMTKGLFVYISGAISKVNPGSVRFETPDATIGIRGTKLVVKIIESDIKSVRADGKSIIVLFKDPAGNVGTLIISNRHGKQTLNKENYSITVNKNQAPLKQVFMDKKSLEQMIPESLYSIVFENYAPPLPYTEVNRPLSDLDGAFVLPPERNNVSPFAP